ncbi:DUF868 family protein (DUF868) [Rhynchospora pubera]|uniref:DUF868 family protein (DUF868) n=1 Tax=Rhynchospora pubera TaxID=906938 RepID=A0AAV8CP45_9POAL|nr:DUF868 family protein (DUF868) [Rhynchospora pubera]
MQDIFSVPSCFSSPAEKPPENPGSTRSGQSLVALVYRVEISGICRLVTVTWCKNLLAHGLSVSIQGSRSESDSDDEEDKKFYCASTGMANTGTASSVGNVKNNPTCKVEMRPWHFWRRYGSKCFHVDGTVIDVFWDLKNARFSSSDDPEPLSGYYMAVVSDDEVVLLLGDLKKEAFRRSGSRPSLLDPVLVSKKEHVFGKKRFSTRAKFNEKEKMHEIMVECNSCGRNDIDMAIKVDGCVSVLVRHLQWKFRGNETIFVNNLRVQVYWDVHDWLFSPGPRHALFIFKLEPIMIECFPSNGEQEDHRYGDELVIEDDESSDFCLFLYAWRVE